MKTFTDGEIKPVLTENIQSEMLFSKISTDTFRHLKKKCQLRSTITNNEKLLHRRKAAKLLIINYTNCSTLYLVYIQIHIRAPPPATTCKKKIDQSSKAKKLFMSSE